MYTEVSAALTTDSFINVLRRFVARRGKVKELHSDNGTNFAGAEIELSGALTELNQDITESALQTEGISWIFNPPTARHIGEPGRG